MENRREPASWAAFKIGRVQTPTLPPLQMTPLIIQTRLYKSRFKVYRVNSWTRDEVTK